MKWLYHPKEGAKLFEDDENPKGWVDSPAKLKEEKPAKKWTKRSK